MRCNSLLLLLVLASSPAAAQATAAGAAPIRSAPDGRLIATMRAGGAVKAGAAKGGWTAVTLEGFLYKSVVNSKKDALTIDAPSGAALRASANKDAKIIAVVEDKAAVDKVATSGDWYRVKRDAWVKTSDLKLAKASPPPPSARAAAPAAAPAVAPPNPDAAVASGDFAAAHPLVLRAAPDGKPNGAADSAARVRIIARDHGWARVEFEGWVRESELVPVDSSSVSAVSAADLRSDPDHYRGSTVRWVVQAIAVQSADPLRKGLAPDEPYLLARGPGSESSLLYLALPPALVASARALQPLAYVMVLARVRQGRSDPSGVPILDVLRIVPR
ncbi:MAG TPA: SH3 domain-containing protein [Gemmatimonadaceae bacterium]